MVRKVVVTAIGLVMLVSNFLRGCHDVGSYDYKGPPDNQSSS